jgi:hypothetical protein
MNRPSEEQVIACNKSVWVWCCPPGSSVVPVRLPWLMEFLGREFLTTGLLLEELSLDK